MAYFKNEVPAEAKLEADLIEQLTTGVSQWTYCPGINTEEKLWANLKKILEANNPEAIDGEPLTEHEMSQIKDQLNFNSTFDAAEWMMGDNGIAHLEVDRDDVSRGKIYLAAFKRDKILGDSTYQVINQYVLPKDSEGPRGRRFDVSLLINGIPMIHIELKSQNHPYMDAYRQIKKYTKEGQFQGPFSALQMFVVSNGTDTYYYAPASSSHLTGHFMMRWVTDDNKPISRLSDFAREALSIPAAHNIISQYTVLDYAKHAVILLRPYQIHAVERITAAAQANKGGYIWHTTGSGKTMTAYKAARNLTMQPGIDKVVFIVDRTDLDQQTNDSFMSYAEKDNLDVSGTDDSTDLVYKLLDTKSDLIITTAQKLSAALKKLADGGKLASKRNSVHKLKLAAIVDECHRSVSAEKMAEINSYLDSILWYGFTGTPVFAENAKAKSGPFARTTGDQYAAADNGKPLHRYTIQHAVNDKAVLGFMVEFCDTLKDRTDEILEKAGKTPGELQKMSIEKKESLIPQRYYDDERHMRAVLNHILNKSASKLGLGHGVGNNYTAILTTGSISRAAAYYRLLNKMLQEPDTISERVQRMQPDFPKFALTYSVQENNDANAESRNTLYAAIKDYDQEFGQKFGEDEVSGYNSDINMRLQRKRDMYQGPQHRQEQLDLVIVADRLLTGFDAPCLSTLFVDRPPMTEISLIQAFSRTNRVFDTEKRYGQVVVFQKGNAFKQAMDKALALYAGGGKGGAVAPTYEKAFEKFVRALAALKKLAPTPNAIDPETTPRPDQLRFVKAFQAFAHAYQEVELYDDFDKKATETKYGVDDEFITNYQGGYQNILDRLTGDNADHGDDGNQPGDADNDDTNMADLEYDLELVHVDEVNYQYILNLIQGLADNQATMAITHQERRRAEIETAIVDLRKSNPKLGEIMQQIWEDFDPSDTSVSVSDLFAQAVNTAVDRIADKFAADWQVSADDFTYVARHYDTDKSDQLGERDLINSGDFAAYKSKNPTSDLKIIFKYKKAIRRAAHVVIEEEVLPLTIA